MEKVEIKLDFLNMEKHLEIIKRYRKNETLTHIVITAKTVDYAYIMFNQSPFYEEKERENINYMFMFHRAYNLVLELYYGRMREWDGK